MFFKDCGEILEVSLLKLSDGKPKGVAFIVFKDRSSALNAIKDFNFKVFMGN